MLSIKNLSVHYGGIHALRGISLDVPAGKIVTLIGANGAGKSTTLNSIMGLVRLTRERSAGMARIFLVQKPKPLSNPALCWFRKAVAVFPNLSVDENLNPGCLCPEAQGGNRSGSRTCFWLVPPPERTLQAEGGNSSGGEQQMLAVGRALMSSRRC